MYTFAICGGHARASSERDTRYSSGRAKTRPVDDDDADPEPDAEPAAEAARRSAGRPNDSGDDDVDEDGWCAGGGGDGDERHQQQHCRHLPGRGLVEGLHPVIDRNGDGARLAGNAAAQHQDDTELTHGMGKTQRRGDNKTAATQRQNDSNKAVEYAGAQRRGYLHMTSPEIVERFQ